MWFNEAIEHKEEIDINPFTKELNFLKKEIQESGIIHKEKINDKINSKKEFKNFLLERWLGDFDRSLPFGRYLRVLRYENSIKEISKTHWVPSYVPFVLAMIESQWNPWSINLNDGWAWILHFQADVARQYGLRVFTDLPQYKEWKVSEKIKQINPKTGKKRNKSQIYAEHARIFRELWVWENKLSIAELEELDERFNSTKCINAACKYLKIIKTNNVDKNYTTNTSDKSRDKYKNDEIKFKRTLTANWFNKWPTNFTKNFESWSHVSSYIKNLEYYENYEKRLNTLLAKWLTWDEILEKLEFPFTKVEIQNGDKWRTYYKYEWPSTDENIISQVFDKWDKKHNKDKYKNTGKLNVLKLKNWWIIIKAKSEKTPKKPDLEKVDSKWPFEYLNKSSDNKYNVYSYNIKNWWNYWWVLKQFQKNWWKIDWTLVTNEDWDEYDKTKYFSKWSKVYVKEKID